jgi:hypothetical protein
MTARLSKLFVDEIWPATFLVLEMQGLCKPLLVQFRDDVNMFPVRFLLFFYFLMLDSHLVSTSLLPYNHLFLLT